MLPLHYRSIKIKLFIFSAESNPESVDDVNKTEDGYNGEDKTIRSMHYFRQLSKQQIQDLYKMYFFDFKLFDYDIKRSFEIHGNE